MPAKDAAPPTEEHVFRLGAKPLPLEIDGVKLTIRRHGDRKRLRIGVSAEKPVKAKRQGK